MLTSKDFNFTFDSNYKLSITGDLINVFNDLSRNDQEVVIKWIYKQSYSNKFYQLFLVNNQTKNNNICESVCEMGVKLLLSDSNISNNDIQHLLQAIQDDNVINYNVFKTSGNYRIENLFVNESFIHSYNALYTLGKGINRRGGGEYALSLLGEKIILNKIGDLTVNTLKFDLKANGGRLTCLNGPIPSLIENIIIDCIGEDGLAFIKNHRKHASAKSLNLKDFFNGVKKLNLTDDIAYNLIKKIYSEIFSGNERYSILLAKKFIKTSSYDDFIKFYSRINFLWYKKLTTFDGLIGINTSSKYNSKNKRGVVSVVFSSRDFELCSKYNISPAVISSTIQGWEYYIQFWPKL